MATEDGQTPLAAREHGAIVLSRAQGDYRDVLRRYRVFIDDIPAGRIGRGQTLRFDVPAGAHRLQLKIDWCSSAPLAATVEAGGTTSFYCAPGGSPSEALASITFGTGDYITLQPMPHPSAMVRARLDGAARLYLIAAFGFFGGGLTFLGALIWHCTGTAVEADNMVAGAGLAVTVVSLLAARLLRSRAAGQRRPG